MLEYGQVLHHDLSGSKNGLRCPPARQRSCCYSLEPILQVNNQTVPFAQVERRGPGNRVGLEYHQRTSQVQPGGSFPPGEDTAGYRQPRLRRTPSKSRESSPTSDQHARQKHYEKRYYADEGGHNRRGRHHGPAPNLGQILAADPRESASIRFATYGSRRIVASSGIIDVALQRDKSHGKRRTRGASIMLALKIR